MIAAKKERPKKQPAPVCIVPGCGKADIQARGVCGYCYRAACRMVKNGQTTFEELESFGLVRPRMEGHEVSPMSRALRAAKAARAETMRARD